MPATKNTRPGLLALLLVTLSAATVQAGPPIPFDQFTVTSGEITALPCPTSGLPPGVTITCGDLNDPTTVVSDGMLQRRVVVSGLAGPAAVQNGTYIQFIITEPGVTGDATADPFTAARGNLYFSNEDFIKMNNRDAGISEKQVILDRQINSSNPNLETRFVNITEYEFGDWANTNGNTFPWFKVFQQISELDYTDYNASLAPNPTLVFDSTADIISNGNGFSDNIKVTLEQDVDLTVDGSGAGAQGFRFVKAAGQYQISSNPTDPMLPDGSNGGSVTWSPGDPVKALWIGQTLEEGAFGTNTPFGFTQYRGVDPFFFTEVTSSLTSLTDTTAVNWDLLNPSVFGLLPTVPTVPVMVAASATVAPPDPIDPIVPAGTAPGGSTTPVALPLNYYGWTISNGVFDVDPCPPSVICGDPVVNERGVFQRVVVVSGAEYIQTIITDENATGAPNAPEFDANSLAFKSENFVKLGVSGPNQGITSTLRIAQEDLGYTSATPGDLPSTGGQFVYNTTLKTGWANGGPLDPRISLDQRLVVPDTSFQHVSSFDYKFKLDQGQTDLDKRMSIRHVVGTVTGGNGFDNPVRFDTEVVQGAFQNTARSVSEPALLPSTGETITWNPFDAIQVTWIAGEYITPDPMGPSRINTTSYINLSTGERVAATDIVVSPTAPESWVDPFTQPPPGYSTTYTPPPF